MESENTMGQKLDAETQSDEEREDVTETAIEPVDTETGEQAEEDLSEVETGQIIEQLQEGNRQLYNQLMRARADFENFKRRSRRDKELQITAARADLFRELLDVLDNFDRAMEAVDDPQSSFAVGVKLIHKQFLDCFSQHQIKEIPAMGLPFDPHLHEAMATMESDDHEENTVIEVFQKGYTMKDELLRPSKVKVATRPEWDEGPQPTDENGTGD